MNSIPSVISLAPTDFNVSFDQFNSTGLLTASPQYMTIGTTSSLTYVPLFTAKYTVDTQGKITVYTVFVSRLFTNNSANNETKIQLSGDGGNTFVDITGDIGGGALSTEGAGLWINEIDIGTNKLQMRTLGRSTDGNPADTIIDIYSYIMIPIIKTLI